MTREIMSLLGKDAEIVVTKIQRWDNSMALFAMMMGLKKSLRCTQIQQKPKSFPINFHIYQYLK